MANMSAVNEINLYDYLEHDEIKAISSENKEDADKLTEKVNNIIIENTIAGMKNIIYIPDGHITLNINSWSKKPSRLIIEGAGALSTKLYLVMNIDIPIDLKECGLYFSGTYADTCKDITFKTVSFFKYDSPNEHIIRTSFEDCTVEAKDIKFNNMMIKVSGMVLGDAAELHMIKSTVTLTNITSEDKERSVVCTDSDVVVISSDNVKYLDPKTLIDLKSAVIYKTEEPTEAFNILEFKYSAAIKVNKGIRINDLNLDVIIEHDADGSGGSPYTTTQKQESYDWVITILKLFDRRILTAYRVGTTHRYECVI